MRVAQGRLLHADAVGALGRRPDIQLPAGAPLGWNSSVTPSIYLRSARQYLEAADVIRESGDDWSRLADPMFLLYFHAVEMAFKAFLLQDGAKLTALKKKWRHDIVAMFEECGVKLFGPRLSATHNPVHNVVYLLAEGNTDEALRYFDVKSRNKPTPEYASETIATIIERIAREVRANATPAGAVIPLKIEIFMGKPQSKPK